MLNRLSINHKKTQLARINSEYSEKENNQKNLNKIKKSARHNHLDPTLLLKPHVDLKNYLTDADNRLNISANYNSIQTAADLRARFTSKTGHSNKLELIVPIEKIKSNTQQFCELYGKDILMFHQLHLVSKDEFLENHEISCTLRARMLDWMVEVMKSYKFSNKTYFAGVELMDRYFSLKNEPIPVTQLHILGVTSMYIATKM